MVDVLNNYFASVFTVKDTHEIQEITPTQPNFISLTDCHFTEDVITKTLDNVKVNITLGPDCIALI